MEKEILVIGGGIAGMAAATALADNGFQVYLLDKETSIGGWASSFCCKATQVCTKCSVCLVARKLKEVSAHPRISLLTNSTVARITGEVGDFGVEVLQNPLYIDPERCIACGICDDICAAEPKAIRSPAPEAVPYSYVLDATQCLRFKGEVCSLCLEECPANAIDFERQPTREKLSVGSIVVATGSDVFDAKATGRFGYGRYANVVTGLDIERIFNRKGYLKLPSNGEIPDSVAFIQCVGSRNEPHGYCSQVCCKYAMRFARLVKHQNPVAKVTIFYIDLQNAGKGFAAFYEECQDEIRFIRGIPVEVLEHPSALVATQRQHASPLLEVKFENIVAGKVEQERFEMVVLSVGMVPRKDSWDVALSLGINLDEDGFFDTMGVLNASETNVKGIFVAGACQGPKDISDSIAHGIAAAEKATEGLKRWKQI